MSEASFPFFAFGIKSLSVSIPHTGLKNPPLFPPSTMYFVSLVLSYVLLAVCD